MADDSTATETAAQTEGTTTETSQTTETTTTEATGAEGKATVEGGGTEGGDKKADTQAEQDWRDLAAGEDKKLRNRLGQFTSVTDLAKAEFEARQKLSNAIFRPGKGAKDEEVAAFRKALGVPEAADKYEVALPDDLPEHVNAEEIKAALPSFLEVAHAAGATPEVVNAVVGWYAKTLADQDPNTLNAARAVAELHANQDQWADELRNEWRGDEYQENVLIGGAALREFGGEEAIEVIEQSGLGNHPAILRMMAKIGRVTGMSEHRFVPADGPNGAANLESEHDKLTEQIFEAQDRGEYEKAAALSEQRQALSRRLGSGPIVGHEGRAY